MQPTNESAFRQGAKALLDALSLARVISRGCRPSQWRKVGISESINRVLIRNVRMQCQKVNDSAAAAQFLHSEIVLARVMNQGSVFGK
jgi:hypothetical protein